MKLIILFCCFFTFVRGQIEDVEDVESFESVFRQQTTNSCLCGRKNEGRIVGGNLVQKNEYPWMAAICRGTPCNYNRQFCGGSLINDQFILTAAHCVVGISAGAITVSLGDHNLASTTETNSKEYKVARIIRHGGYDDRTVANDIALLKLSEKVQMTNTISPVCLPTSSTLTYRDKVAHVVGWGTTSTNGASSKILRDVAVTVRTNALCSRKYGAGVIRATMLCASRPGKDSCQGDSGGPLTFSPSTSKVHQQIGIVSFGYGCADADYPGVYTRVNKYLTWISRRTTTATYCRR